MPRTASESRAQTRSRLSVRSLWKELVCSVASTKLAPRHVKTAESKGFFGLLTGRNYHRCADLTICVRRRSTPAFRWCPLGEAARPSARARASLLSVSGLLRRGDEVRVIRPDAA